MFEFLSFLNKTPGYANLCHIIYIQFYIDAVNQCKKRRILGDSKREKFGKRYLKLSDFMLNLKANQRWRGRRRVVSSAENTYSNLMFNVLGHFLAIERVNLHHFF